MSNGLGPPYAPDLDADGFPLFPALPGSRPVPAAARSLARLVAGLRTGVIGARTESLAAMVVFLDREPIDGLAIREADRVTGPDVLDEIAHVPIDQVTVAEVRPELAAVLGSYFLPTSVRDIPAGVLDPDTFIHSLARPGQRGCVLVRAADSLGLVFVDDGEVRLAYRDGDGEVGGLDRVAGLLREPGATIWARLGPAPAGRRLPPATVSPEPVVERPAPPPPVPPEPRAHDEPDVSGWSGRGPSPAPAPPREPTPIPERTAPPPDGDLLEIALAEVRQVLGPHAVRVEPIFRAAEPTPDGLCAAARSLRARRFRLLSPATMELVANRVLAALGRESG